MFRECGPRRRCFSFSWVGLGIGGVVHAEACIPWDLKFWINGKEAATGKLQRSVPGGFTASETFDVGMDLNSPVADDYFDKSPFKFEGTLEKLHFKYLEQK